jgi:predicted Zn-dependent protease
MRSAADATACYSVSTVRTGAFAVRRFKTQNDGCSLGPLTDYVTVAFKESITRTLAHELGHACNLWHYDDPDNLMTPGRSGGVGYSLSRVQKALVRMSRHVTYF